MAKKKNSSKKSTTKKVTNNQKKQVKKPETKPQPTPKKVEKVEPVVSTPVKEPMFSADKIISLILSAGLIAGFAWFGYSFLPNQILKEDENKAAEDTIQEGAAEPTSQDELDEEAEDLSFEDQVFTLVTNFGNIPVNLTDDAAPRNTENFIRLASRDYFDGIGFHRMVEQDNFAVIQGGDPRGDGTGGESAFGTDVEDEIFVVAPQIGLDEEGNNVLENEPEFNSNLYGELDPVTGTVTYQKGLMIMANRGPNTNGSQFFLTLEDTILPPQYTIIGQVTDNGVDTLDAISEDVDPIGAEGEIVPDGKPSKDIIIEDVELSDQ